MMRPIDYASDLRDILLRRYSWKNSEVEGLVERFRRQPRCYLGLHYPKFGDMRWSYYEPPDQGWYCRECNKDALPLWFKIVDRLMERKPVYTIVYWWHERHDRESSQ